MRLQATHLRRQRLVTQSLDMFSFLCDHVVPFELLVIMLFLDELHKLVLLQFHCMIEFASLHRNPLFKRRTYAVLFWSHVCIAALFWLFQVLAVGVARGPLIIFWLYLVLVVAVIGSAVIGSGHATG